MNQKMNMTEIEEMHAKFIYKNKILQEKIDSFNFTIENNLHERLKECQQYLQLKFDAVLTDYGLVSIENHNKRKTMGHPYEDVNFDELLMRLYTFLRNNPHILLQTKRVSYDRSSYGMKHTYSYHSREYYNKKGISNSYCTNGQFIFAMYLLGYDIYVNRTPTELVSCGDVRLYQNFCCNVYFNAKFKDKVLREEQFN